MRFFEKQVTLEALKAEYKRLCRIYHPDLGGDEETMKAINLEYEAVLKGNVFQREFAREGCKTTEDIERAMREVIERLIVLQGISIEICGTWLWVTGNTYPVKDCIKAAGCWFARKKSAWYWRPADAKSRNRKPLTLEEIRTRHGSITIEDGGKKVNALT